MKYRILIAISGAIILVIGIGSSVLLVDWCRTIKADTLQVRDDLISFRIVVHFDGRIYGTARQLNHGQNGWYRQGEIGEVANIGISNASIVKDDSDCVSLRFGRHSLFFSPDSLALQAPSERVFEIIR
jgi:hypothetical protein